MLSFSIFVNSIFATLGILGLFIFVFKIINLEAKMSEKLITFLKCFILQKYNCSLFAGKFFPTIQTSRNQNHVINIMSYVYVNIQSVLEMHVKVFCFFFINVIGNRLIAESGDSKWKKFLFERISLAIQRGNAASIRDTFPDSALLSEIFAL
jgi:hypothetical protein